MTTTRTAGRRSERGFTLAGVLVLVTIVMVFVAYTVPRQWSSIMQRERELQTIYAMRQYARACVEFNRKHRVWPSSIDQMKEARLPRFMRGPKGELIDPLTGEVDWLVIPATGAGGLPPGGGSGGPGTSTVRGPGGTFGIGSGGSGTTGTTGTTSTTGTTGTGGPGTGTAVPAGIPIKDYAGGPFIGVRPPKSGESIIELRGAKTYEQWSYTAIDLQNEVSAYLQGIQNSMQWK
jgi:type II secretory pathway pseudopilin PulG